MFRAALQTTGVEGSAFWLDLAIQPKRGGDSFTDVNGTQPRPVTVAEV